jgi:site-specific DNA-cytosine methylase
VDDGVRTWMDGSGKVRNSRNPRLKSLGNAIVPQVAMEIMQAIKNS